MRRRRPRRPEKGTAFSTEARGRAMLQQRGAAPQHQQAAFKQKDSPSNNSGRRQNSLRARPTYPLHRGS